MNFLILNFWISAVMQILLYNTIISTGAGSSNSWLNKNTTCCIKNVLWCFSWLIQEYIGFSLVHTTHTHIYSHYNFSSYIPLPSPLPLPSPSPPPSPPPCPLPCPLPPLHSHWLVWYANNATDYVALINNILENHIVKLW